MLDLEQRVAEDYYVKDILNMVVERKYLKLFDILPKLYKKPCGNLVSTSDYGMNFQNLEEMDIKRALEILDEEEYGNMF